MKALAASILVASAALVHACSSPRSWGEKEGIALWQAIQIARPEAPDGTVVVAGLVEAGDFTVMILGPDGVVEVDVDADKGAVEDVRRRPVRPGRETYAAQIRALLPGAKFDLIDAIEIAQQKAGGRAEGIRTEVEGRRLGYVVAVRSEDSEAEVFVDAVSGAVTTMTTREGGEEEVEAAEMEEREPPGGEAGELGIVLLGGELVVLAVQAVKVVGFDDVAAGKLPAGWKVEGTKQEGPLATWKVVADESAPSKPNVLALTSVNHESGSTFNLCWTDTVRFQHGSIEARFQADAGAEDQGGGLVWRVKDKDNYYVCRANPLEGNFRVYVVQGGNRKQLGTAKIEMGAGTWHTIQVGHEGSNISCSLDGKRLLSASDATFSDAGGVGFWTKADAATRFDDLKIEALPPVEDAGRSKER